MIPGRYEFVFVETQEVVGSMTVTADRRIGNVTGMLRDHFEDGVLVADVGLMIARLDNGYYTLRRVEAASQ
jgi:hypothetical protein